VGFENFAVAYPRYQQAEWFAVVSMNTTNTSAHDWILHVAATTGAVGLLANVALLGAFAFHAWRRARDPDAAGVIVALAAVAAFYGSGLVLPGAQSIRWIPWVCVGLELAKQNEPGAREAAYEAMRRALAADPQNPESFDRFAHIQLALADYSGAIESERRAIALFPTVPGYYTFASEAAHQLGDSATA